MSNYQLTKRLPACRVNRTLLIELERYLLNAVPPTVSGTIGEKVEYSVLIEEAVGEELFDSIEEYSGESFPDGTRRIRIGLKRYGVGTFVRVAIDFQGRMILEPELEISVSGSGAREFAIGLKDSIWRVLHPRCNYNRFFRPKPIDSVVLPLVSVVAGGLLVAATAELARGDPRAFGVLCASVVPVWYLVSSVFFRPYVSFDTARQTRRDAAWRWLNLGFTGFVIFGSVLPGIRKHLLGF